MAIQVYQREIVDGVASVEMPGNDMMDMQFFLIEERCPAQPTTSTLSTRELLMKRRERVHPVSLPHMPVGG